MMRPAGERLRRLRLSCPQPAAGRPGDCPKGIREFYNKFGDKLPAKLDEELKALEQRLG